MYTVSPLRRPYTWLTWVAVSAPPCWHLSCGIPRLLPRRYVLLTDVRYGRQWSPGICKVIVLIVLQNLEVFFCLYAHNWNNPAQCNSQHSRILGFLSTLPGIWRGLQCLRRYYDTRNAFPHLVNFGKYTFTILCYMTLSLYRIDKTFELKALFITCATINSVYCCTSCPVPLPQCSKLMFP